VHKPVYGKPNPWRNTKRDIWLPAEKHYLRCHWGYIPSKIIARHLGRTKKAVQQQAYNMRLTKKSYRKWNQAEIEALNWFYSSTTVSLVSNLLGRTRSSVKVKAAALNIRGRKTPVAWDDADKFKSICSEIKSYIDNSKIVPTQTFLHTLISKGYMQALST